MPLSEAVCFRSLFRTGSHFFPGPSDGVGDILFVGAKLGESVAGVVGFPDGDVCHATMISRLRRVADGGTSMVGLWSYDMEDTEIRKRLAAGAGDNKLRKLRIKTAISVAEIFDITGTMLPGILKPANPEYKDLIAVAIILRMAGELTASAANLFSSGNHYAGAALLRQLVEIEYLTWNFKERAKSPSSWLDSTHEERMKQFSPSALRKTSKGRFLSKDY